MGDTVKTTGTGQPPDLRDPEERAAFKAAMVDFAYMFDPKVRDADRRAEQATSIISKLPPLQLADPIQAPRSMRQILTVMLEKVGKIPVHEVAPDAGAKRGILPFTSQSRDGIWQLFAPTKEKEALLKEISRVLVLGVKRDASDGHYGVTYTPLSEKFGIPIALDAKGMGPFNRVRDGIRAVGGNDSRREMLASTVHNEATHAILSCASEQNPFYLPLNERKLFLGRQQISLERSDSSSSAVVKLSTSKQTHEFLSDAASMDRNKAEVTRIFYNHFLNCNGLGGSGYEASNKFAVVVAQDYLQKHGYPKDFIEKLRAKDAATATNDLCKALGTKGGDYVQAEFMHAGRAVIKEIVAYNEKHRARAVRD